MHKFFLIVTNVMLMFTVTSAQTQPSANFHDLLIQAEQDPSIYWQAKQLAIGRGLPISIQLPSGIVMYPAGVEQDKPVYAVITNPLHPFEGGYAAFYDDIERQYDLSSAKKIFERNGTTAPTHQTKRSPTNTSLLLVPDWTADRVWAFDPITGDLVDTAFIHSNSTALESPKQALKHPLHGFITVSDQIRDLVQKFNPDSGTWLGWFAPSGGVNNSILDNIRGHAYRPNDNLLVTVASGSNSNTIAQFDTGGNYIGNFIGQGVGGLNSPFDILFRENDILISQSSAPTGVKQYDLEGGYLSQWATISSFPQQMFRMSDGRMAVANFSGTGSTGIRLYDVNGNFLRLLSGVTGNRGVYQLPNGNFLTTNSAGIHEIDSTTGNLVRTIQTGTNFQYINLYTPQAAAPVFGVSPTHVMFGTVPVGSSRTDSVTVSNSGTAALVVSSASSSYSSFSVFPDSATIAPSASRKFYITFTPEGSGMHVGEIVFTHNAAGSPDTVIVEGLGNTPPAPFYLLDPPNGDTLTVHDTLIYRWERAADPDPADTVRYTIFRSSDGGSTWFVLGITTDTLYRLPTAPVVGTYLWTVHASDGYTSRPSLDVFSYVVQSPTSVGTQPPKIPLTFSLAQNYPNPFNPVTNIKYALPVQSKVTLEIFNVLGQKVRTLVNNVRPAGYHVVEWNGISDAATAVGSGVYFVRVDVRAENGATFSNVRKLMLLK